MSEATKFLLRKATGDQTAESEQEIRDWFQRGQCKPADFLFDFATQKWCRVGEHPLLAALLGPKPATAPDRRLVYLMSSGGQPVPQGPFSMKEIQGRIQARELTLSSWVFVEGDKEWRQVRAVKALADLLPALPTDLPAAPAPAAPAPAAPADSGFSLDLDLGAPSAPSAPPAAAPAVAPKPKLSVQTNPSIRIDLDAAAAEPPSAPPASAPTAATDDDFPEREEATMAISALGLSLQSGPETAPPSAPPVAPPGPPPGASRPAPLPGLPPAPGAAAPSAPSGPPPGGPPRPPTPGTPPKAPPGAPAGFMLGNQVPTPAAPSAPPADGDGNFDGLTAEIPVEPIWLVKPASAETVSGPFRFLEVVKFLEEGRLTKNDKISKVGTNRFVKIQQQYEFNVKFSLETVIEHGVEKQKILIKRRHPRVPYITGVQVLSRHGMLAGNCINISAGGLLLEVAKADLALGEIIEIKILPGLIARSISCKAQVIGKIPKMPPGFALKFEDLKNEDKEAIEFFVQETLKRELS